MIRFRWQPVLAAIATVGVLGMLAVEADARPGKSGSAGSRGSRTYTPPPATNTAPNTARPIERSTTPAPQQPSAARPTNPSAAPTAGAPQRPGFFNRPGFLGGLAAGLLGAGLIGMLFGHGLFGNLGGLASILGLLVQLALIGGVAWLLVRWWQRRSQPQPAFAGGAMPDDVRASTPLSGQSPLAASTHPAPSSLAAMSAPAAMASSGPGNSQYGSQAPAQPVDEIGVKPEDYDAFERLLGEIQLAYSREDVSALRERVTPEMMQYLSEDLSANASRGLKSELSNVKLLQGDLAEAWSEGPVDYATVAMRYELIDTVVDRNTKQVVEGDANRPVEVVELWTFTRSRGGGKWMLSAIQQTDDEGEAAA